MNNEHESKDGGKGHQELVEIHIDKQNLKSPTPTTGHALYELGHVDGTKYDLWLEVPGKGDDKLISDDTTPVELKNGMHFYTAQKNLNPGSNE